MLPPKPMFLLLCLLLIPFQAGVAASGAYAEVRVVTLHPAGIKGQQNRDGMIWHCQGRQCVVKGRLPVNRLKACQWLAGKLGPVTGFAMQGHTFSSREVTQCNGNGVSVHPVPLPANRFGQLPNRAHSRMPSHTPEWRDHHASDPGYSLSRQPGQVRFGDAIHGRVPPPQRRGIPTYRSGQGSARLGNPAASHGGSQQQSTSGAERRLPGTLQHRQRAVTEKDMKPLASPMPGVKVYRAQVKPAGSSDADDAEQKK